MVVHILGKPIRGKYLINYGLAAAFYGLGLKTATRVCSKLGFYPHMRMHQLSEQQTMSITKELSEMTIDSKLLSQIRSNIQLKKNTGSYAGLRHAMGLPVRGQRTKTNAKTARKLNKLDRKM
ncbi:unnamed protein product [[Candida] boidinii]|uniref:Unnamed protein product n=1 Tax=Candida boidinii TaxID=5477 RepID=A0A9W6WBI9_CANBO|nr:hypothetical protein BVG19_g4383 [[Candida] boidinii]OWB51930.1 hypothetical protein B5S27_g3501 [[Candida] boidinii]OWB68346.1 hypothetical protein B5S30_g3724 [[Candida] boidinii]OWB83285.1 hypothetical protein B5S33_g1914 [[Candida] boidinii]GME74654.1 unnamed protein product [[Candida] boidinii]